MKYLSAILIILFSYVGSYAQTWRPSFRIPLSGELAASFNYQNLNEYLERNVSTGSIVTCDVELSMFKFRVNYLGKIDSIQVDGNLNKDATSEIIKNIYRTNGKWEIPDNSQAKDYCWFVYPFYIFGNIRPCKKEKQNDFYALYSLYQLYSDLAESVDKKGMVIIAPNRYAKLEEK